MKNDLIYFDNAATSFPKPAPVVREVMTCLQSFCGNPGRGGHRLSLLAGEAVYSVREAVSDFLGVKNPERVVFTPGATFALNLAMKSSIRSGSHILISDMEHNSVLRVAEELKKLCRVEYDVFNSRDTRSSVESLLKKNTTHLVSTLASNVTGEKVDMKALSDISKQYSLKLILDASQLLGHERFSLEEYEFDALCCAGHKALFGIPGVGFAVFNRSDPGEVLVSGGSGTDSKSPYMPISLPERFEAGTLPLPAIVSLGAGIEFINSVGIESIAEHLKELTELLKNGLSSLREVSFCRGEGGIIAFTAKDIRSEGIAAALDEFGICVRGGFHCAPLMHEKIGTYKNGAVRISLSYLNTAEEAYRFLDVIEKILKKI